MYAEKLESLDRLLAKSRDYIDLERYIDESIKAQRQLRLIEGIRAEMKQLEEYALKVSKLEHVSPDSLMVNSQYREWYRGGRMRHGYIATILPDSIALQGVSRSGPMILAWYDNPQTRLTYLSEFRERCRRLLESLAGGELDDLTGKPPREVLHMLNGAHGELVERLGLESSYTVERILEPVLPRLVIVCLKDSEGKDVNGATVHYYQKGWKRLPGRTGSQFHEGVLTGLTEGEAETLRVRVTHRGAQQELKQSLPANRIFVFQTRRVQVHVISSDVKPIQDALISVQWGAEAVAESYSEDDGRAVFELLPGEYLMSIVLGGVLTLRDLQVGESDDTVLLQTGRVWSSTGACTQVYAQRWLPFTQGMELLPGEYWFSSGDGEAIRRETIEPGKLNMIH